VAGPRKKDVLEMLGDFFREAAVLVTVFFPLEFARRDAQGKVSLVFLILVSCIALFSLVTGIIFEKLRGQ
jgi:hypothetical protein